MVAVERVRVLTRDFFRCYPDYMLCRTMAENVVDGVKSHPDALRDLSRKARASQENARQIEETLDRKTIRTANGQPLLLKHMKLREMMDLDDSALAEAVDFYCKHPYAHGRTRKSRWLPRWFRTLFLGALLGHAKRRDLDLDYGAYFDLITLL